MEYSSEDKRENEIIKCVADGVSECEGISYVPLIVDCIFVDEQGQQGRRKQEWQHEHESVVKYEDKSGNNCQPFPFHSYSRKCEVCIQEEQIIGQLNHQIENPGC